MPPPDMSVPEVPALLQHGRVLRQQPLPSSNCTYVVELGDDQGQTCLAVYKPRDGEAPLWDFPQRTLYRRERLAYLVSEALRWCLVPITVVREGPEGIGVMQRFIHSQRGMHYFNLMPGHREDMLRIALLDCLLNNCDRKGGHCLLDENNRVWAIDHGLTFSPGRKLRTVMWDLAEHPIPTTLLKDLSALSLDGAMREELARNLAPTEVAAFYERLDLVLASPVVPIERLSDPYRPLPWPAI